MSLAWLTYPLELEGSRAFMCDPLTTEECDYYMQRWHFWYELSRHQRNTRPTDICLPGT